ncbi:MAG: AMP-binding protein, partial [Acidimicrobiia bacterium]
MTTSLHAAISEMAALQPEAPAVVMGSTHISYASLDDASSKLANGLRKAGCQTGDRVALLLRKSPEAIVAIVGALKAGCAYVPLDPQSPDARLAAVLESCQPSALIGHGATAASIRELSPPCPVATMDSSAGATSGLGYAEWLSESADPLEAVGPSGLAYIMYTSGSTGQPKGVPITHSNATHLVDWAIEHYELVPGDRNSGHSPLHFDLSVLDIFATLRSGGTLHLIPPEANLLPASIAGLVAQVELTQWFSVPSILTFMAKHNAIPPWGYPSLQRVMTCGEVLPAATLAYWMERVPHAHFANLYGPTETTVASSFHDIVGPPSDTSSSVPIGVAIPGEDLMVLTGDMQRAD